MSIQGKQQQQNKQHKGKQGVQCSWIYLSSSTAAQILTSIFRYYKKQDKKQGLQRLIRTIRKMLLADPIKTEEINNLCPWD